MNLKDKLKTLPKKPGCYLMKDNNGSIIYVGKAVDLKNRVNSYFIGAHDYKTTKLVHDIKDFDYIVVKNEKEALILEYNLIKQHDPKYNIVFKDDKSYPYILLSNSSEPYCSVVRKKKKGRYKGKLFGPYPNVGAARNVLDLVNKLFPTRKCQNLKDEVCLYYHLKQCPGYCVNKFDDDYLNNQKQKIENFLKGDTKEVLNDLKAQMKKNTEELNYELAANNRDLINSINETISKQNVQINNRESFDIFSYYIQDSYVSITGLFVKQGRLLSSDKHIDYLVGDVENYVSSYIYQFYQLNPEPKQLYVDKELLVYLENSFDFEVLTPQRGNKYALLKQAKENAQESLRANKQIITKNEDYYEKIKDEFNRIFNREINRIEIFDNSHTGGVNTVAAMVVYEDFKPNKKEYRLYKLEDSADDLSSMKEVLYRRYFRVLKDNLKRPDLIIVDGARTQIEIAKEVIESLGMDIPIVGLGKDDHHNTSYMLDSNLNKVDIDKNSNLFFFLTNVQDEVHRFAITYHKKLRRKAMYKSFLDGIEGLGPKSRTKLLRKFGSIANIKEASLEELKTILNSNVAERLYNKIMGELNEESE